MWSISHMTVMCLDLSGFPDPRHEFDVIWLLNKNTNLRPLGLLYTTTKTKVKPYPDTMIQWFTDKLFIILCFNHKCLWLNSLGVFFCVLIDSGTHHPCCKSGNYEECGLMTQPKYTSSYTKTDPIIKYEGITSRYYRHTYRCTRTKPQKHTSSTC